MDIRKFFGVNTTNGGAPSGSQSTRNEKKKVKALQISDDEDVIPDSPLPATQDKKKKRIKHQLSSDSEDEFVPNKVLKPVSPVKDSKQKSKEGEKKKKLEAVNVMDVFGSSKAKRVMEPEPSKEPKKMKLEHSTEIGVHEDKDFQKTLVLIDSDSNSLFEEKQINTHKSALSEKSKSKDQKENKHTGNSKRSKSSSSARETESKKERIEVKKLVTPVKDVSNDRSTRLMRSSSKTPIKTEIEDGRAVKNGIVQKLSLDGEKSESKSHHRSREKEGTSLKVSKSSEKDRSRKDVEKHRSKSKECHRKDKSKKESPQKEEKRSRSKNEHDKSSKSVKDHNKSSVASKLSIFSASPKSSNKNINKSDLENDKISSGSSSRTAVMENKLTENRNKFSEFIDNNVACEENKEDKESKAKTPVKESKNLEVTTPKSETKSRKRKASATPATPELTEEERQERKRYSAQLYKNYKNRSGPKNPGSKPVPQGSPNCFLGLAFIATGELESLSRDEVSEIVAQYGGEMKKALTGKVTHMICGEEAGPAKMAKAEQLGTKILSEDQFLDLIREKSKPASGKQINSEGSSKKRKVESKNTPKKHLREKEADSCAKAKKSLDLDKMEVKRKVEKKEDVEMDLEKKEDIRLSGKEKDGSKVDNLCDMPWVEKYKPENIKQIIGQQGEGSNVNKLCTWLQKWYTNRKLKIPKPSPWAKGDGGYYRAALLSGPPGVGKTTTVALVCKELGFDTVEFNASDTRSKNLIKEQVSSLVSTNSLSGFVHGKTGKGAVSKKHVVIMDEVDGMAGNEDRGGMQELIALIKQTSVPIICMCNDKTSQKMRSLVGYCYDLSFSRPKVQQIKGAMMRICCKEGIKITPAGLEQVITGAQQDVRQILNLLSVWSAAEKNMSNETVNKDSNLAKKDFKMGPWDVVRKVFSEEDHKKMSIHDKSDLFFHDYSLSPLFVQHNYLKVVPHCPKKRMLERFAEAADCLSIGDLVDSKIRGSMAWSLLPVQAMYSSVLPGTLLSGHMAGQIEFPAWLGQYSRTSKMHRLAQELHSHTGLSTSGSKLAMRLDYASHLKDAILHPLISRGSEGVQESVDVLEAYHLLREDLESLHELAQWPGKKDAYAALDSKVKAAMTRAYNKQAAPLPYSQIGVKKSRVAAAADSQEDMEAVLGEEATDNEEEDDGDVKNDAMIKMKKPIKSAANSQDSASSSGSSKSKASSKGKGKGKGK